MSEMAKTVVFVVVGVAALGMALLVDVANRPQEVGASPRDQIGKPLFEDFDALDVTELEIVKWNEDTGKPRFFKVAQVNNVWSIPSHSNYPADAEDQLTEAAPGVMGLKVIDFVSENPGEFSEYGVIDPGSENIKPGTTGVGTRVVMKDAEGNGLVSLVIGKEVPDTTDLHYVRRIGQDPIYIVEVDTSKLSTRFQDWIEKDLLKLSTWDIKEVRVLDYSFDELAGRPQVRGQFAVEYDDQGDTRWKLLESKALDTESGDWTDRQLDEGEELDTEKLNDLKYALDDLEIVNVARKPEGLSADLRDTGAFEPNQEAWASLAEKGFYLLPVGQNQYELISNEGEVRVLMKDGVQYTLRFGEIVEDTSGDEKEKPAEGEAEAEDDDEKDSSELNRYIFVMAEFNPDMIEKPELEPLPELPTKPEEAAEPDGEGSSEEAPSEESPAEEAETAEDAETEEGPSEDGEAEDTAGAPGEEGGAGQQGEPSAAATEDTEKPEDSEAPQPAERPETDEPAETVEEPAASDDAADTAEQPAEKSFEEQLEEITRQRERIEKENKRKQEEYEQKIEDGKERVAELNARFADWYYVISDEVYQQIHLSFDQIVKEKEKEEGEDAGDTADDTMSDDGHDHAEGDDHAHDDEDQPATVLDELDALEQEGPGGAKE